jgi:hypothetical protein
MRRRLPRIPAMTSHERSVLVATCLSSLGSFYTMAVTGFALPQIQRGLSIPDMGQFCPLFKSTWRALVTTAICATPRRRRTSPRPRTASIRHAA